MSIVLLLCASSEGTSISNTGTAAFRRAGSAVFSRGWLDEFFHRMSNPGFASPKNEGKELKAVT